MSKLKPCPFCGGANLAANHHSPFIVCEDCGAFGPGNADFTHEEAIEAWNIRAPEQADVLAILDALDEIHYAGRISHDDYSRLFDAIAAIGGVNPDGLPNGLTLSDDGNLLDWRGENYVRQSALESGECEIVITWKDSDYVHDVNYRCSKCGGLIVVDERNPDDYFDVISHANYCCNCGRRVMGVKQ